MPATRASKLVMSWRWPGTARSRSNSERIYDGRDLRRPTAARFANGLFYSPFCAGSMLMDPDVRRVDEDISKSGSSDKPLKIRSHVPFCAQRQNRV